VRVTATESGDPKTRKTPSEEGVSSFLVTYSQGVSVDVSYGGGGNCTRAAELGLPPHITTWVFEAGIQGRVTKLAKVPAEPLSHVHTCRRLPLQMSWPRRIDARGSVHPTHPISPPWPVDNQPGTSAGLDEGRLNTVRQNDRGWALWQQIGNAIGDVNPLQCKQTQAES
jgi:hypothetical protein